MAINVYPGRVYVRQSNGNNAGNVTDEWPWKMEIGFANYFCDTPKPNVEINDSDIIAAWNLPPKSWLSSIMWRMGHCEIAANQIRSIGREFDASNCHCVKSWPILLFIIVCFAALIHLMWSITEFLSDNNDDFDEWSDYRMEGLLLKDALKAGFVVVILIPVCCLIGSNHGGADIGFMHMIPYDIYPKPYYVSNINLHVVGWCVLIIFSMIICAAIWNFINVRKFCYRDDTEAEHRSYNGLAKKDRIFDLSQKKSINASKV